MTTETRLILWGNRFVSGTLLEWCTVALLREVEESVWAQGLGAPATAHALRHELDDTFKHRQEAKK